MLITADWVLPVSRPPIRNGAVLIERGVVREVGPARDLEGLDAEHERFDHPGCVLTPGLVNAHTHLSLTALGGLFEADDFAIWLGRLVEAVRAWDIGDHAASASLGAHRCLEAGVTVVGDIAYGPESPSAALVAGLGGAFFWEVLGIGAPALDAELEKLEFPVAERGACGSRMRCGLSPHSAYTSGPQLLRAVHEASLQWGVPFAMHVAESRVETDLLRDGSGPLLEVAERAAHGFRVPGVGPVAYLDRLGVLDGATVVHAGHISPTDIVRLASTARGVVTCPRSNAFLSNPVAPVARLLRAGIPVGIGTDSAASNHDLDLMEDVRALHALDPSIPPKTLVEMATAMGAIALGLEDRFGILEPGMQGDVAIFRIRETHDPEADFVRLAGAKTLEAVYTTGAWRIREGAHVEPIRNIEAAARATRVRTEHAIGRA